VSQYAAAYQSEYLRVTQGQAAGTIYLPPTYVPPTPIYTTPPTVLNPPQPVYVPPQPTGTVLNPPQGTSTGVTPTTVVNTQSPPPQTVPTGTSSIPDPSWFAGHTQVLGMNVPNIALAGVAGLAAVFLVMGKK
jgi:hypothetical protein